MKSPEPEELILADSQAGNYVFIPDVVAYFEIQEGTPAAEELRRILLQAEQGTENLSSEINRGRVFSSRKY